MGFEAVRTGIVLGLIVALLGCASPGKPQRTATPEPPGEPETPAALTVPLADEPGLPPPRPIDPLAEAQYQILVGELALRRGQPDVAARAFVTALRGAPNLELAQRATQLALRANDETLALEAAEAWVRLDPTAAEAREVILRVNLLKGRLEPALVQARLLAEGHAAGVDDGYRQLAVVLMRAPRAQADAVMAVMNRLVGENPRLAGAQHALGMVALRFGRYDEAEAAAEAARRLAPERREHALLLAGVWVRQGRVDEALGLVDSTLADQPAEDRAELRLGFARVLLEAGRTEAAEAELRKVLGDDPDETDATLLLGMLLLERGETLEARRRLTPLLEGPRAQEVAMQLGRLAERERRWEEALALYAAVTRGPAALDALVRRAWVLGAMGRVDEGRALLAQMREEVPQIALNLYLAEGDLLTAHGTPEQAVAAYTEGLAAFPDSGDLRYGRSLAFERLRRIPEAEADLRAMLQQNPEEARALNALGYMLLIHTDRLDEAGPLIEKAIALRPDDPAIIDSKGWLLFKRGQPEAALPWLERAHAAYPDPEVAAHLGEVLWVLGRRDEARRVWAAALAEHPDHPVLRETVERLAP